MLYGYKNLFDLNYAKDINKILGLMKKYVFFYLSFLFSSENFVFPSNFPFLFSFIAQAIISKDPLYNLEDIFGFQIFYNSSNSPCFVLDSLKIKS